MIVDKKREDVVIRTGWLTRIILSSFTKHIINLVLRVINFTARCHQGTRKLQDDSSSPRILFRGGSGLTQFHPSARSSSLNTRAVYNFET